MAALTDGLRAALADRYRIDRELGRGGMATVYLAHDLKHDRPVALKLLHQELAAALGPGRFLREIRTAARLQHPHILGLLDSGETAGLLWYTMPYVEGESLRDRLRREVQLPVEDAIRISQETALALDYAHRHGVIHRDIKPENILLSDGQALVADFGLAQALDHEGGGKLTGSGIAVGTPAYMSPEQATAGQVGPRSDVYALGCVLYELLAGEPPFSGSSAQAILAKRVSSAVPRVRVLRPTVPEPLEQAVTKALAPMAADRYATAGDFCRALATAPIFTSGPTFGPSKGPTAETPTKSARQVFRVAATLGLGLLIGVAVLFAWLRTGPSPNAPGPKRVAVLPFENIGDSADAYFADGVTDAVRGKLVGLPGLQVTARGSSSQYRGTTKTPQQIGQELGVQFLLTATVRWEKVASRASRVQVTPELVEVASATTTWQRPFDAALTGVFQVQAEIAGLVAQALDLELSDSSRRHLAERPTQSLEAYDAYLRGQEVSQGMTSTDPAAVRRATLHYAQAVALDSGFYQAWAQLSGAHSTLYLISIPTPAEAEAALRAAERALALAPKRVEGHLALSAYYSRVRQDHALALEELARAEQLAPPDANLLKQMAVNELNLGRWEAALAHLRRAWSLDPRSVNTGRALTMALLCLRRYPEATEAADRAGALAPTNLDVIMYKAMVSLGQGDLAGARSVIMAAPKEVDPIRLVAHFATYSDLYWVLNDTEQRVLLGLPPDAFDDDTAGWGLVQAQILWQRGERARARVYADSARIAMQGQLRDSPQNAERRALYGLSLAYLGRKSDAVREGERSLAAMPIEVDAYNGPYLQHQLARIYILINEPEKALDLLEPLLGVPYLLSPGWLRIDPTFDPLRSHPRFQRLVVGRPSPASKPAATRGQP